MRSILTTIIVMFMLVGLGTCTYYGPDIKKHFGVRYGNADREIFEETKSFVHGNIQNLNRLMLEYKTSEGQHKEAIRMMILTECSVIDMNKMPYTIQTFVNSIK